MHTGFLKTAAIIGALTVILGAFAAHGLKKSWSADNIQIFETGVRYQFYHVFALMAVAILFKTYPGAYMQWAGYLFLTGMLLFSGSLYLLGYIKQNNLPYTWVGAITPFGGLAFIVGWICIFLSLFRKV